MRKIMLVSLVLVTSAITICCGSSTVTNTKKTSEFGKAELEPTTTPAQVSIVVVPERILLSKIRKDFVPYPDCYGGECYQISFRVALKLKSDTCIAGDFSFGGFIENKGASKTQKEVLKGKKFYKTLSVIDPQKVSFTIADGGVTKVSTLEEVLWGTNN